MALLREHVRKALRLGLKPEFPRLAVDRHIRDPDGRWRVFDVDFNNMRTIASFSTEDKAGRAIVKLRHAFEKTQEKQRARDEKAKAKSLKKLYGGRVIA